MIKKVVIIGPESTGKSTLCAQLAAHYNSMWCPEYAREYLLKNGTNYTYDDLNLIAKGQLDLEDAYTQQMADFVSNRSKPAASMPFTPVLFLDTDMYVMKVWCEFVFGKCHQSILDQIVQRNYHLYLLCNTDLPWTKDALREYPDLKTRETLFYIYKDLLINQSTPWVEIKGNDGQRLEMAIDAVNRVLNPSVI